MKFFKRLILILFIVSITLFLFRGMLYQKTVAYRSAGPRINYTARDETLIALIEKNTKGISQPSAKDIARLAQKLSAKQLNYTFSENENDPNRLVNSRTANCIGYAAFCATTCNYLFKKYKLSDTWAAQPQIGKLFFLGINVHNYFSSPFFKDHDFVIVENKSTGEVFAMDPSLRDYIFIDFVTFRK